MVVSAAYLRQRRQEVVTGLSQGLKDGMLELSNNQDLLEIKYLSSYTDNYHQQPGQRADFRIDVNGLIETI